ncbi:MAG: hypothetical protein KC457_16550 [Myxococcales bacterium]|nr:hypothetical protein [Myxococcales bacterium]
MTSLPFPDDPAFDQSPLAPGWEGPLAHIGPVQTVTPLVDMLSGKTTCATVTLLSGVLLWGARRLQSFTETDFLYELAAAAFAWQHDWRSFVASAEPYTEAPDEPIAESAAFTIDAFLRDSIEGEKPWHSFYQPIMPLFHMANVVNFILPSELRGPFEEWLVGACGRLDIIARAPAMAVPNFADFPGKAAYRAHCAPRRGRPLPPTVLDLRRPAPNDIDAEAALHLAALAGSGNRFLAGSDNV